MEKKEEGADGGNNSGGFRIISPSFSSDVLGELNLDLDLDSLSNLSVRPINSIHPLIK